MSARISGGLAILRCWYRHRQLLLIHEIQFCDIYHNLRNFWWSRLPATISSGRRSVRCAMLSPGRNRITR